MAQIADLITIDRDANSAYIRFSRGAGELSLVVGRSEIDNEYVFGLVGVFHP